MLRDYVAHQRIDHLELRVRELEAERAQLRSVIMETLELVRRLTAAALGEPPPAQR